MSTIEEYRKGLGLTQKKLADKWGVTQGYISRLESGQKGLSFRLAVRIHRKFGVPLELLAAAKPRKSSAA